MDIVDQITEVANRYLEVRMPKRSTVVGLPPYIAGHIALAEKEGRNVAPLKFPKEGAAHIHSMEPARLEDLLSRIRGAGFPDAGFELGFEGKNPSATLVFGGPKKEVFH